MLILPPTDHDHLGQASELHRPEIPMNQTDFLQSIESTLQLPGVSFSRAALQAFVEAAWPLIRDNPDVEFWAREFIDSGNVTMLA